MLWKVSAHGGPLPYHFSRYVQSRRKQRPSHLSSDSSPFLVQPSSISSLTSLRGIWTPQAVSTVAFLFFALVLSLLPPQPLPSPLSFFVRPAILRCKSSFLAHPLSMSNPRLRCVVQHFGWSAICNNPEQCRRMAHHHRQNT